jgi:hypothetical protein
VYDNDGRWGERRGEKMHADAIVVWRPKGVETPFIDGWSFLNQALMATPSDQELVVFRASTTTLPSSSVTPRAGLRANK